MPLPAAPCFPRARRLLHAALGCALLAQVSSPVGSTPICRWVDATGRIQLSERVPAEFRAGAICIDSLEHALSPEQQQAADQQHAADLEARAKALRALRHPIPSDDAVAPVTPASPASRAQAKRPSEQVTDTTDCVTWWRLYETSAACFGAFRTVHGAIKAQAFDVCNVVASPEPVCGPRRD